MSQIIKSQSLLFFTILLYLTTLLLPSNAQNTVEIYVDSNYQGSKSSGTLENPYNTLQKAFEFIQKTFDDQDPRKLRFYLDDTKLIMNLKEGGKYEIPKLTMGLYDALPSESSFIIRSYPFTSPVKQLKTMLDCTNLPVLYTASLYLWIDKIKEVRLEGLKIINSGGGLNMSAVGSIVVNNTCFLDSSSSLKPFLIVQNSDGSFVMENIAMEWKSTQGLVNITNKEPRPKQIPKVSLTNITITLNAAPVNQTYPANVFHFKHSDEFYWKGNLSVRNFDIRVRGQKEIAGVLYIEGYNTVNITGLSTQNQSFLISKNPLISVRRVKTTSFMNTRMIGNQIIAKESAEINMIYLFDKRNVAFEESVFWGNVITSVDKVEAQVTFVNVSNFEGLFAVKNERIESNIIDTKFYHYKVNHQYSTSKTFFGFTMMNISIENNSMGKGDSQKSFQLIKIDKSLLTVCDISDLKIKNNMLEGRLFYIERLNDVDISGYPIERTQVNMNNILMAQNILSEFALISLFTVDTNNILPPETIFNREVSLLRIKNLTLMNNTLGTSSKEQELVSLVQVKDSQVFLGDSRLLNNTMENYNLISLYRKISSVYFVENLVENNVIKNGHLIITLFEGQNSKEGSYLSLPDMPVSEKKEEDVWILYRYAVIIDSTFKNIQVKDGSLFTVNTGFLLYMNNRIEGAEMDNSFWIDGGRFTARTGNFGNYSFVEDPRALLDLGTVDLRVAAVCLKVYAKKELVSWDQLAPSVKYFYVIEENRITNVKFFKKNFIQFQDYNTQGNLIWISFNNFENISSDGANFMDLTGSVGFLLFQRNILDGMRNIGHVLGLALIEESQRFVMLENILKNFQGKSFVTVNIESMALLNFRGNYIAYSIFSTSLYMIEMAENNGWITWAENGFFHNILRVTQDDPDSRMSFISMVIGKATSESEPIILNGWKFANNTFENEKSMLHYKQLNAFFSFLLGNSTLDISNSVFLNSTIQNSGSSMFYIASAHAIITNCSFTSNLVSSGDAFFTFLVPNVTLINNKFDSIRVSDGYSLIYLSPYPYLQTPVKLYMMKNNFTRCSAMKKLDLKGAAANVLVADEVELSLNAQENLFTDSFESNALMSFKNTKCFDCLIERSTFILTPYEKARSENLFFSCDYLIGNLLIVNSTIYQETSELESTIFLQNTNSPNLNLAVDMITWPKKSQLFSFQLVNTDSGNLTFLNTEIGQIKYIKNLNLIQASSSVVNNFSGNINLRNITMKNIRFNNQTKTGLIYFTKSKILTSSQWTLGLQYCIFEDIHGTSALSTRMSELTKIDIRKSIFQDISYRVGSAINYDASPSSPAFISIKDSLFLKNFASETGGAIALAGSYSFDVSENQFVGNAAEYSGGAIFLNSPDKKLDIQRNNIFLMNQAAISNDLGFPFSDLELEFELPPDSFMYIEKNILRNCSSRWVSEIGLSLTFMGPDHQPASGFSENLQEQRIELQFGSQMTVISSNCTFRGCSIDRLNLALFNSTNTVIPVTLSYYNSSEVNSPVALRRYFEIEFHSCIAGEYFNPNTLTCDYCPPRTYSLDPQIPCTNCPLAATCFGGNNVALNPGYLWTDKESMSLIECRKDGIERCVGTSEENTDGCKEGYKGSQCEACDFERGYVESGLLSCQKCEMNKKTWIVSLGILGLMMAYHTYCVGVMYEASQGLNKNVIERGYYLQLKMMFMQIFSMIMLYNYEIREFIGRSLQLGNPSEFVYNNLECWLLALGLSAQNILYASNIAVVLLPWVYYLVIISFNKIITKRQDYNMVAAVYFMLLFQPGIIGHLVSHLSCSDTKEFDLHPSWRCEDHSWLVFRNVFIIPMLVIFTLIAPLYIWKKSLSYKNILKSEYSYWSLIVMGLKVLVSVTMIIFHENLKICLFTVFIFLWSYQILNHQFKPYRNKTFNKMETVIVAVLILDGFVGYFMASNEDKKIRIVGYLVLIAVNFAVMGSLISKIVLGKYPRNIKEHE